MTNDAAPMAAGVSPFVPPSGEHAPGGHAHGPRRPGASFRDAHALADLASYSNHPSAFLALNRDTQHFRADGMPGFIAYREAGAYLFQLGGVFAPALRQPGLLREFCAKAQREGR